MVKKMKFGYRITGSAGGVLYEDGVEGVEPAFPRDSARVNFYSVNEPRAGDFSTMMKRALAAPYGTPRLREIARGRHSVSMDIQHA